MDIKMINNELGNTDLFLIDQILKNRFQKQMRILDAGCGEGRNMVYFVKNDYNIYGIDDNEDAIRMAKLLCRSSNKNYVEDNIQSFAIEDNPFPDNFFDAVLCINVLHTVSDHNEFFNVLDHLIRLVKTDGLLFLSMQGNIGLPVQPPDNKITIDRNQDMGNHFYLSDDLLTEVMADDRLMEIEPIKTILFNDNKSYTYLLLKKKN